MSTIQRHDFETWLGPALEEMTEEQVERAHRAVERISDRYPDEDESLVRDAASAAAVQYILGELTLEQAAAALVWKRIAEREASAAAQQVAVMAVEDGMTEAAAARLAGIDRMTLRKARGK